MIIETCGSDDHVLKLLPPLILSPAELAHGLSILRDVFSDVIGSHSMATAQSQSPPAADTARWDDEPQWVADRDRVDCDLVVGDDASFIFEDELLALNDRIAKQSQTQSIATPGRQTQPGLSLSTPDLSGADPFFPGTFGQSAQTTLGR
jgi:hypothetical protein